MGRNDGNGDILPMPPGQEIHPKGLLEAIAYIEQNFANELGGAVIRDAFLTTKQRLEFFEVGFRGSFLSGLISALLTPFAIGVIERHIPVFGSASPDTFDLIFAFLLAVGYSLGFAIFLAYACTRFVGTYTRAMIRNLLGGVVAGAVMKGVLAFIGFHFLYIVVMTDGNLRWAAGQLYRLKLSRPTVAAIYRWVYDFREIFLTSAWFVLGVTIVFIAIPTLTLLFAVRRNKKLVEAGVVKVE